MDGRRQPRRHRKHRRAHLSVNYFRRYPTFLISKFLTSPSQPDTKPRILGSSIPTYPRGNLERPSPGYLPTPCLLWTGHAAKLSPTSP